MLSRSFSILISAWLPMLAVCLPIGPVRMANALVAGTIATLLSFAALADRRAAIGMAIIGGWVALSPFIFDSTLIEKVLTVSWGLLTFVHLIGPFADAPIVAATRAPETRVPPAKDEPALARAA